ncbi:uncharacterized protein LOC141731422 [Zonotrichia albicollis]|uniref:uncharacterized protein LOC141731422 n=1 Tax=Zonotrichia albicollis TaxID=44394 RepID=UPI003D80E761
MPLPATPPASREPEFHSGPRGPAESAKIPAKIEKKDPVMGAAIFPETTCRHGRRHLAGNHVSLWAPPSCRNPRVGMGAAILTESTCRHGRRHLAGNYVSSSAPPSIRAQRLPRRLRCPSPRRRRPHAIRNIIPAPGDPRKAQKSRQKSRKKSGHGGRHLPGNHVSAWAPPSCRNPRVGTGAAILPESTCRYGRLHLAGNSVSSSAPPSIRAQMLPRRLRCPSPRRRRPHANRNFIPAPGDPRRAQKSRQKSRKKIRSWGPPSSRKPRVGMGAAILPESTCRHGRRHLAGNHVSLWAPPSCRNPRVVMGAAILPEPRVGMGAAILPETTCRHGRRHLGLGSTTQQP